MKDDFEDLENMSEEELFASMSSILSEVNADDQVKRTDVPKESYNVVFSEIRKMEEDRARESLSEEDKKLLAYGKRYKRQLRFRKYWILAAAMVLAMAMGITSVGGPQRFFKRMIGTLSGRNQEMYDSSEGIALSETLDEDLAYDAIEEKYGFRPVKVDCLPEGVVFEAIDIEDSTQQIKLLYTRNASIFLRVVIYPNYRISSVGVDVEDEILQEYIVWNDDIEITVREYAVKSNQEMRWSASLLKDSVLYIFMARNTEQSEFETILQNLYLSF